MEDRKIKERIKILEHLLYNAETEYQVWNLTCKINELYKKLGGIRLHINN